MRKIPNNDLNYILYHSSKVLFLKAKLLITGGTGFIGKWLLESILYANEILNFNIHITVLSRNPEFFISRFPHLGLHKNVQLVKGDIRDFDFPDIQFDYIIHGATDASAKMNVENPLEMAEVVADGTRHLLEFARICNPKKVLFLSSGAVYGKQPDNLESFSENYFGGPDPLETGSAYAESKRMAELLCAVYARQFNVPVTIARCFAFIGPYLPLDAHYAAGNFINDGLHGRDITVTGDGSPLRTYMYASDMVIWLLNILLNGDQCEAYNVGSDVPVSIKELAFMVARYFPGIKVNILNQTRPTDRNQNYIPDIQKAINQFHFSEGISLSDAIGKTIRFYQNQ